MKTFVNKFIFSSLVILLLFLIIFSISTNEKREECYDFVPMKKVENTWYTNNRTVIHASGGIDGLSYTNSQESFLNTIQNGGKVVEIDFDFTSDGYLVCYHLFGDINANMPEEFTLEEFLNTKIQGKYTPMRAEDVISIMEEHPEVMVSIDTKNEDISKVVKYIVDSCKNEEVLNRFIVQCFYPGDKTKVKEIYSFPEDNYLFAAYKDTKNPYKVMETCYKEKFNVVVVKNGIWSNETLDLFAAKNIYVYVYTVNRTDIADNTINNGVYGIYTDFLFDYVVEPIETEQ